MNKKDQTKAMVVVGLLLVAVAYYISKRNSEGFMNRRRACFDCHEGIEPQDSCPICYGRGRRPRPRRPPPPPPPPRRTNHGTCQEGGRWYNTNNDTCNCSSGIFHTHASKPELKMCRPCGDLLDARRRREGLWYGEEWYKGRRRHFQYESRGGQCGKNYFLSVAGARAGCGPHRPCEWVPLSPGSSVEL